ncbi:cellulose binding domain-containing protein, partial [Micromonospora sp. URMC 106]|uniref:cellulose binding domain-containing protein n=1 Tax=Micromonospora sp. URMC 106 TaxID=3423408 RepID=UPI003F1C6F4A
GGGNPTTPPPTGGCAATYRVTGSWQGGFQGELVVRNAGSSAIAGWTVGWTFPDGQKITQLWGGTHTQTGAAVSVRDAGWNGALGAGASTTVGFLGSWTGTNGAPATVTCTSR